MSCNLTLQDIGIEKYDIIHLNDNSNLDSMYSALSGFAFGDKENILITKNPSTKLIKKIEKYIEKYTFGIPFYIVIPDNYPDLRSSFYSGLSKNNKIKEFPYFLKGDIKQLENYIKAWLEEMPHVKLTSDNVKFIVNNAPSRLAQVKTKTGKYENAIYDLMALESELSKIDLYFLDNESVNNEWLQECFISYGSADSVWDFIKYAINGNTASALKMLDNIPNIQSSLFLALSQLKFLMVLKGAESSDVNDVLDYMKGNSYLGRYLNDWIEPEEKTMPPVNYYRIQKASQEYGNISVESLSSKYLATLSAIQDLRQNVDPTTVLTYYALALNDKVQYNKPIKPIK